MSSDDDGARKSLSALLAKAMDPNDFLNRQLESQMRQVNTRSARITRFLKNVGFERQHEGPVEIWLITGAKSKIYLKVTQPTYEVPEHRYEFHLPEPLRDKDSERGAHLPTLKVEVSSGGYLCELRNIGGNRHKHSVRTYSAANDVVKELQGYLCDAMPEKVMTLIDAHTRIHKPEQP